MMMKEEYKILLDFNKFYAGVVRVLEYPKYNDTPVMVASNNHACNICFSPANLPLKLPITMGTALFQIEHLIRQYSIEVFSVTFPVIWDFVLRARSMVARFFTDIEYYSCDEMFITAYGTLEEVKQKAAQLRNLLLRGLKLPVSCGIARTKTLAKVAIEFAKKRKGYNGVCAIDTEQQRIKALQLTEIGDVWGIGRQYGEKLRRRGITNAYDFTTKMEAGIVKAEMTIVGLGTWKELRGEECIDMEYVAPKKKSIMVSRSFGYNVSDRDSVFAALTQFGSMAAAKLRAQGSKAKYVSVFIRTNRFRKGEESYKPAIRIPLPVATSSSVEIAQYIDIALMAMYREGLDFRQAGVMLSGICDEETVQGNIFDCRDRQKEERLMKVMDAVDERYGRDTLRLLSTMGGNQFWGSRVLRPIPCWTTRMKEFPVAVA